MEKFKRLMTLYWSFFKMGIITFGGGYAMLPILQREVVDKQHWATEEELLNYFAVGQCTPGIIAVNTATFIGKKQEGIAGGIFATMGLISPSILIIMIIGSFIKGFADNEYVQHAFVGIRVAVAALVTDTVVKLFNTSVIKQKNISKALAVVLFCATFLLSVVFGVSPVWFVIATIAVGIFMGFKTPTQKSKEDK